MQTLEKRKSIIHIQNLFLVNPLEIYVDRQTQRYIIGYEPKYYRIHNLLIKIDKSLIVDSDNQINFENGLDINVREDFRNTIKSNNPIWKVKAKNITVRIVPTKYSNLTPLYGMIYHFGYRKTNAGGIDLLRLKIPECPLISNYSTIDNICFKMIGIQRSGEGTHGMYTYIILAKNHGEYLIGEWIKVTNQNRNGKQNEYIKPVTINL